MNDARDIQFIRKLNELPFEAQWYFESGMVSKHIQKLNETYNIPDGLLTEIEIDIIINGFNPDIALKRIMNDLKSDEDKAKHIVSDFMGRIFHPISQYIKERDIDKNLSDLGANPHDYDDYKEEWEIELEEKYLNLMNEFVSMHEFEVDLQEERESVIEIFKNNLKYLIVESTPGSLAGVNSSLILLFNHDPAFKQQLEKLLIESEEIITSQPLRVGGKQVAASISNWINDFITFYGSGIFENLELSKYLMNSSNIKNLEANEKMVVAALLNLYRNIKFYPVCFNKISPEEWHIVPIYTPGNSAGIQREASLLSKSHEEDLQEYDNLAAAYPEGSLERRAILEEKKKYERKLENIRSKQ